MEKINVTMDFNEEFRLDTDTMYQDSLFFMRKYEEKENFIATYCAIEICDLFHQLNV